MRTLYLSLIVLSTIFSGVGFTTPQQAPGAVITLLDRENQPATRITDGDTVHLQVTLQQATPQTLKINFNLAGQAFSVATCSIPANQSKCSTGPFASLGWSWGENGTPLKSRLLQAVEENGNLLGTSEPILVTVRPVVMVHGFISDWETWKMYLGPGGFLANLNIPGFAVGDGQVAGILNTGQIFDPAGRTNTIGENAAILGEYIAAVKQKTGAQMVDLVVHSMGGMISRYYIDRVMQGRDVAQLIMLGSPMGGSDCAVLPAALGFYLPASIEIRQSYMNGVFNQQITHRHGVEFFDLAGTAITEAFKSPCSDVPNDTVVSLGSVNAIPLQAGNFNIIHSNLTISQAVFETFVKPLLQKTANQFQAVTDPAMAAGNNPPLQFTRVYTGHVEANGSTQLTINIEPGLQVASFALYDASRSITSEVRGASGNVIKLTPEANGFIQLDDPSALFWLGYGFREPKPGPWRITLQATEVTPPGGTDFAVSVYFSGGAKLETSSSTLVPQVDEQVDFFAQLSLKGQPLEITSGQVVIMNQEGQRETLTLPVGSHVSATWTPPSPGTYAVDIVVNGKAPDGSTIERTGFLAVEVQPNPTRERINFNLAAVIIAVVCIVLLLLLAFALGIIFIIQRQRRKKASRQQQDV